MSRHWTCRKDDWRVGLAISDKFPGRRNRRNKWLFPTEFRLFRRTENSQNSIPNPSAKRKQLRIPFPGTKIEGTLGITFWILRVRENNQNFVLWNKNRRNSLNSVWAIPPEEGFPLGPKLGRQGRISFQWAKLPPTELHSTLLSYTAPYWATLHLPELRCTLVCYTAPY